MAHKNGSTWTERTGHGEAPDVADIEQQLRPHSFQKHHSSMGAVHIHSSGLGVAGHIIHMAGVFIPVAAGELIQDATQYKKVVRLASIGTALAYEIGYTVKEHERQQALRARLDDCRGRE